MQLPPKNYDAMVKRANPPSPVVKDCLWAFFVGGAICLLGEALRQFYLSWYDKDLAGTLTSITLVMLSAITTVPGWYQKLAAKAGAGTLVPITGFANSVVSPAVEFKAEGWVTGVGAKIFTIAGPVIAFGTLASFVWGVVYWLVVTAAFLLYTFGPRGNGRPQYSWFIWAIGGILYAALVLVVKMALRKQNNK